jgi:hypothetical protein
MEARLLSVALVAAALLACGANYRSENFIVHSSSSDQIAREVCTAAEQYRRDLAIEWLGKELPPWREPCPINLSRVRPQELASGKTSFYFYPSGEPHGWDMEVNGTRERVLDSVLPHEITHTIFATHFGCALPRWADEGGSTTVEHASERAKQQANLIRFLKGNKGIAFSTMFRMTDYPPEMLPLYAQGYSLTRFLIMHGGEQGKRKFVTFVGEGMQQKNWTKSVSQHYGFKSLQELQDAWVEWVKRGSPEMEAAAAKGESLTLNAPAPRDVESSSFPVQVAGGTRGVENLSGAQGYQMPPRPSTFASRPQRKESQTQPEQSVARPSSTGWYARQKDQPQAEAEFPKSAPSAFPAEGNLQPVRQVPAGTPVEPSREEPSPEEADARPPLPGRKLLMEWSRQPRKVAEPESLYAADERNNALVASGTLAR